MSDTELVYRIATLADVSELIDLIAISSHGLATQDYTKQQIDAAIGTVWGVDEELIRDQTYFVVEVQEQHDNALVACGGWSKRAKLFGASEGDEQSPLLNPATDASRIRAFFVHPAYARRGIGKKLIELCETAARQAGFKRMELMATLPGHRLYKSCGYIGGEIVVCGSNEHNQHDCIPMYKILIV